MNAIRVIPSGSALGADIEGIDISQPLTPQQAAELKSAWAQHLVLRFRGQALSDPQLEAFSACFGTLDAAPVYKIGVRVDVHSDFVTVISNVKKDGVPIGDLGDGEAVWHTDMSYNDAPPMASALHALEIPSIGGETGFCNMYEAYRALPDGLRQKIATLTCRHDSSRNSAGELRGNHRDVKDPREAPGAVHPLVIRHPDSGRPALFLGRRRNAYIIGLSLEDSEALLDEIWSIATQDAFTWYQHWQLHDTIMWDNRCTMHRRNAFDGTQRRIMHRTQIAGHKPEPDARIAA
jgi:taurine dioxygenase